MKKWWRHFADSWPITGGTPGSSKSRTRFMFTDPLTAATHAHSQDTKPSQWHLANTLMRGAWLPALLAAVKSWMRRLTGTRRATTLSHHPWLHPLTVAKRAAVPEWLERWEVEVCQSHVETDVKGTVHPKMELHLFVTQCKLWWHFSNPTAGLLKAMISTDGSLSQVFCRSCGVAYVFKRLDSPSWHQTAIFTLWLQWKQSVVS